MRMLDSLVMVDIAAIDPSGAAIGALSFFSIVEIDTISSSCVSVLAATGGTVVAVSAIAKLLQVVSTSCVVCLVGHIILGSVSVPDEIWMSRSRFQSCCDDDAPSQLATDFPRW